MEKIIDYKYLRQTILMKDKTKNEVYMWKQHEEVFWECIDKSFQTSTSLPVEKGKSSTSMPYQQ